MRESNDPIYYDGGMRERHEAVQRIDGDAVAFAARAASEFEGDQKYWLHLLDHLNIPTNLDCLEGGTPTIYWGYSIQVAGDRFILRLTEFLPRQLEATFVLLAKQSWCVDPRLYKGSIEFRVRGLDPVIQTHLERTVAEEARTQCEHMRGSIAALEAFAAPSPLPRAGVALDRAIQKIEASASARLAHIRAVSGPA